MIFVQNYKVPSIYTKSISCVALFMRNPTFTAQNCKIHTTTNWLRRFT